jgi:hypothetical protein
MAFGDANFGPSLHRRSEIHQTGNEVEKPHGSIESDSRRLHAQP